MALYYNIKNNNSSKQKTENRTKQDIIALTSRDVLKILIFK